MLRLSKTALSRFASFAARKTKTAYFVRGS